MILPITSGPGASPSGARFEVLRRLVHLREEQARPRPAATPAARRAAAPEAGNGIRVILRVKGDAVPEECLSRARQATRPWTEAAPTPGSGTCIRRCEGRAGRTRPARCCLSTRPWRLPAGGRCRRPAAGRSRCWTVLAARLFEDSRAGRRGWTGRPSKPHITPPDAIVPRRAGLKARRPQLLSAARAGGPLVPQVEGLHLIVEVRAIHQGPMYVAVRVARQARAESFAGSEKKPASTASLRRSTPVSHWPRLIVGRVVARPVARGLLVRDRVRRALRA